METEVHHRAYKSLQLDHILKYLNPFDTYIAHFS
jgi:hypothetical protein